jgi:proton-dependent oligopeptide transporter, POT family
VAEEINTQPNPASTSAVDKSFFGHPRGLSTLFFTELWERFGYYGMRGLLILFMTASVDSGGLGFSVPKAGAIYGIYTSMVYLASLPGGWIADKLLGQQRAVIVGGIIMSVGYLILAAPGMVTFYGGLVLVIIGTGMLKPNVSTIVGQLYSTEDRRRDAGFSIFYMGINLGAFLAPLACGYVGETYNFRWGLALAGVGMVVGVITFLRGKVRLGDAGLRPATADSPEEMGRARQGFGRGLGIFVLLIAAVAGGQALGLYQLTADILVNVVGLMLFAIVIALFGWMFLAGDWTPVERKRILAILVLFLISCFFFSLFEQAGSTLNLFAKQDTDRNLLGFEFPASWLQSLNSFFIWSLAPVFAWFWLWLGRREPSSPAKFMWGLVFVGAGFLVLIPAAFAVQDGGKAGFHWLLATYLFHTMGELCLSPVGLSATTKLAPARVAGMMMGVWFVSISMGNYLGGRVASFYEAFPLPMLFGVVGGAAVVLGIVLSFFVKPIVRLMGGVK